MLDGFRFFIKDKTHFEEKMLIDRVFDFGAQYSITTGCLKDYPKKTKWQGVQINISDTSAFIAGSLHKFFNNVNYGQNQNHDDFRYSDIQRTLKTLESNLGDVIKNKSKINILEMGFNLEVNTNPKDMIVYRFLMYNFNTHTAIKAFGGKGYLKEFKKSDYLWKIYDKTLQYGLESQVLRIELKITNNRVLERYGINHPEDLLNKEALRCLFDFFMNEFEKLNIIDNIEEKNLSILERNYIVKTSNPKYWLDYIERGDSRRIIENRKKTTRKFINSYKLNTIHNHLKTQLIDKFESLISS